MKLTNAALIILTLTSCASVNHQGVVVAKFERDGKYLVNIAKNGAVEKCYVSELSHKTIEIGDMFSCDNITIK